MGTGCRIPPNRAVGIRDTTHRIGLRGDGGHRTAPKKLYRKREKKKRRQMEKERRLNASDPECVPETTVSAPHPTHMGTQSDRDSPPRALVYKMDDPRFQTFSLV